MDFHGSSSSRQPASTARVPSPGRLNSLHDLVLDYVSHHAYASTAEILSRPRPKRSGESGANGANGNGDGSGSAPRVGEVVKEDGEEGMDLDTPMVGENGENGENGNGSGRGGDIAGHGVRKDTEKERLVTASDLQSIQRRRVVLNYILDGAILRAIDSIQTHFPAVLDESKAKPSVPSQPHLPTSSYYPSMNPSSTSYNPLYGPRSRLPAPRQPPAHSIPVNVTSLNPAHVMLNLKIQAFIERFRHNTHSAPSTPGSSIESLTSSMHMSTDLATAPGGMAAGLGVPVNKTSKLAADLTAVQDLHAFAKNLPADERAVYLPELQWINSLFAYSDPETSILKGFLEQERRIALAEQVNSAILASEEKNGPAFLYSIAERTTATYAILNSKEVDPRPNGDEEKRNPELAGYWKQNASGRYHFSLHDFVDRSWN